MPDSDAELMGVKIHTSLLRMPILCEFVRLERRRRALAWMHGEPEAGMIREDEEADTVAPEFNCTA